MANKRFTVIIEDDGRRTELTFDAIGVAALTGTPGGAANGAFEAIADPADSPGTADALRDDLVANALPSIRNNLEELATKLEEIRAALVVAGIAV